MLELKDGTPKPDRLLPITYPVRNPAERKQQRMMVVALGLLLVALAFVLYRDRDFWFPDGEEAEAQPVTQPAVPSASVPASVPATKNVAPSNALAPHKNGRRPKTSARTPAPAEPAAAEPPAPANGVTATRTVLPPLEVEVVAGDTHKTLRPGTNSVRVDLEPGAVPQRIAVPTTARADNPATVTSNAAERVQMSADAVEVVSRPVRPDYPLLARQMKVQGSVILQALIGRDGLIQDLHVLSGPPILASAAEEAVKQWHFKPHYQGTDTVETQAKITVNFTISTN